MITVARRCGSSTLLRLNSLAALRSGTTQQHFSTSGGSRELKDNDVVILSFARTPIGNFMGGLSSLSATQLGAAAVKEAIRRACVDPDEVDEAFLGNVVSAGLGQAPARQAALFGGLPKTVPCTTVNKVCASGMKAAMLASQTIALGHGDVVVAGGFESMSNIPHYLQNSRKGLRLGNGTLVDGLLTDALTDVYNEQHMGMCAEVCADTHGFSRDEQDDYALESYRRAAAAWDSGKFKDEVFALEVPQSRGKPPVTISRDHESPIDPKKVRAARPAFKSSGSVTAANASTLNDGAAALVLSSAKRARELGLSPLARVLGYADAARDPVEFTVAPSDAVPRALSVAGIAAGDVDFHEVNEAFAVVALANMRLQRLDHAKVNVNGGAVALGHPLGASGARIIGTLYTVLKQEDGTIGCASICNGGGGASAIVIERLK
ncbi:acetyl-CoA acetyltransferase [Tribonema minus]|uniref:Acetyl-CoA acetyltransferase n=1 Tax=Tribonema minus TaxID=303371 RepID=A0A836CMJ8_9STRA|nr:acetyl-CoA acetyltransferase [Tribonema minus]